MGNPIMLIDPTGKGPTGDYYDWNDNYIGNDGIDDKKEYNIHQEAWNDVFTQFAGKKGEGFKLALANYGATERLKPSPYLNRGFPPISPKGVQNNASEFTETLGNITTGYEAVQGLRGKSIPSGMKGVNKGITLVDGINLIEDDTNAIQEYQNTGNTAPLKESVTNIGVFIFETAVVDRALTSGHPLAMGAAGLYYMGKFVFLLPKGSPPILGMYTEEEKVKRYNDNLRVGNIGNTVP